MTGAYTRRGGTRRTDSCIEENSTMKTSSNKTAPFYGLCLLGLLAVTAAAAPSGSPPGDDTVFDDGFGESADTVRAQRGLQIAPVSLDLQGHDPLQVGLGSYMVNAFNCNQCHTNPPFAAGGNPFQGQPKQINAANYLAGGTPFGPVTSPNITPAPSNGLPAGLPFEAFEETMRLGTNFHCPSRAGQTVAPPAVDACQPLLQEMPWPVYRKMTDTDLRAIYAYLSVIPHAEPSAP